MNDTERKQIKSQLLKCAKENDNKGTFTGYVNVSLVCRAAVGRIEELEADIRLLEQRGSDILKELLDKNKRCMELEKENEELRNNGFTVSAMTEQQLKVALEKGEQLEKENEELKEKYADLEKKYFNNITDCDWCDIYCNSQLIKAKEMIKNLYEGLDKLYLSGLSAKQIAFIEQLQDKTEQFIKEIGN